MERQNTNREKNNSQIIRQTKIHLTWCCRMEHRANLLWIPPDSDYNIKEVSEAAAWTHCFSFYFTQIFGHAIIFILHMHYFSLYLTHIFGRTISLMIYISYFCMWYLFLCFILDIWTNYLSFYLYSIFGY